MVRVCFNTAHLWFKIMYLLSVLKTVGDTTDYNTVFIPKY